jgi:hypothetical protein
MYPDDDRYGASVRDRVYGRATNSGEGRRSVVIVLLTVSIFVLIVSVSCRQATAPGPARNVLEAGLVTLTDIDQMIADEGPAIRQAALESEDTQFLVAGYPLDIVLSRSEVLNSSDAQLRDLILSRSSALVYAQGIEAFDRTGEQKLRRFSLQGILELGVGQISHSTYERATFFALIAAMGCALAGAILAATGEGWGRMKSVGFAAIAGSVPALLLFFLLRLVAGAIGGDDPFIDGYREITTSVLGVPLRNAVIVFIAGVTVVALSVLFGRLEGFSSRGDGLEYAEDDW